AVCAHCGSAGASPSQHQSKLTATAAEEQTSRGGAEQRRARGLGDVGDVDVRRGAFHFEVAADVGGVVVGEATAVEDELVGGEAVDRARRRDVPGIDRLVVPVRQGAVADHLQDDLLSGEVGGVDVDGA